MFGLFNKKKEIKCKIRRRADGTLHLLAAERDRFNRQIKPLEEIIAQKQAREELRIKEEAAEKKAYNDMLTYFGLSDAEFKGFKCDDFYYPDSCSPYKNPLQHFYKSEMQLPVNQRVPKRLFNELEFLDWKYILKCSRLPLENNEILASSELFCKLLHIAKATKDDKCICEVVTTVLNTNNQLAKQNTEPYVTAENLFELLPDVYIAATQNKMSAREGITKLMYDEIAKRIGKEHIFYCQYRALVGENADKDFWDKYIGVYS